MKSLICSILLIFSFAYSKAQFSIQQNIGSSNTLVNVPANGGLRGGLINRVFTDTTSANSTNLKFYDGAQIKTITPNATWWRDSTDNTWIQNLPGGGSGALGAWTTLLNTNIPTDISLNGYFGTTANNGIGFYTNNTQRVILPSGGLALSSSISDTTANKIMTFNPSTKAWGYSYWFGGGGGSSGITQLNQGFGTLLTPSPITTTGEVAVDSSIISTHHYSDSINALNNLQKVTDRDSTTTNSIFVNSDLRIGRGRGTYNSSIAFGRKVLNNNTSGTYNIGFGDSSLFKMTTGTNNIGIGWLAGAFITTGQQNIRIGTGRTGFFPPYSDTTSYNTSVGYGSLAAAMTGLGYNTAVGVRALAANTSGYSNDAHGVNSLWSNTTGIKNSAFGGGALEANITGNQNAFVGQDASYQATSGDLNAGLGYEVMNNRSSGSGNSAIGYRGGGSLTTGGYNSFLGYQSGSNASQKVDALRSFAIGTDSYTTEDSTGVIGASYNKKTTLYGSLFAPNLPAGAGTKSVRWDASLGLVLGDTTATPSIIVSDSAWSLTGNAGTNPSTNFIGTTDVEPLIFKIGGERGGFIDLNDNTAFGHVGIDFSILTGANNTGIGAASLSSNVTGADNTGIGAASLNFNTSGDNNIAIGSSAGKYNTDQSYRLYINSLIRADIGSDTTKSIIYGAQDATASNQRLYLNSRVFTPYLPTTAQAKVMMVGTDGEIYSVDTTGLFGGGSGGVSSVSGTANRITSTGGTTPVIDISATYDALINSNISDSLTANEVTFRNPASGDTLLTNPSTNNFLIKSLVAGSNITLTPTDTTIVIASTGGGTPSLTQYRLAVGDASNLLSTNAAITGNRLLISDANGVPTHSAVTNTEAGYLSGVTSAIQTQLNAKGTGTVTATAGSLTANALVLGAGTTDTKVSTGITSDGTAQINLGVNATTIGKLKLFGNTSGDVTLQPTAAAGTATTQTLPATTGTLVNRVTTANGVSASNTDGALSFTLGAITPSTVNGNTITTGSSTFTGTAGQTYTFPSTTSTLATLGANTFTGTQSLGANNLAMTGSLAATGARVTKGWFTDAEFTNMPTVGGSSLVSPSNLGTGASITTKFLRGDGTWQTIPGGGDALTSNPLSQFASTTSAQLATVMSDEVGTDKLVYNTNPTLVLPSINNVSGAYRATATAAGTTTLSVSDKFLQYFTGTNIQTVVMPDATTLTVGMQYEIVNNSSGVVTVNKNGGTLIKAMAASTSMILTVTDISSAAGVYTTEYSTDLAIGNATATTLTATTVVATAGAGFQNMVVQTSGSAASWSLPAALQVTGAKFKVTIIGGGGQGGGTSTTAGQTGGGGGSGGVVVYYVTYVAGQNTMTYTVGAGGSTSTGSATGQTGTASSIIYNSVTITASGGVGGLSGATNGAGGAGGAASGGTLNIAGFNGSSSGTMAATSNFQGDGGNTPLGFGQGGRMPSTAAGANGNPGLGYGAGGSGGRNGTGTTARNGGAGVIGVVIIEY